METKRIDLAFEVKEVTDEGRFSGLASTYDNVDLGRDVVRPGAFTKTIKESKSIPILYQHDPEKVIGEGALRDTKEGLVVDAQLDIDIDPLADLTHKKLKRGRMKGLSIGFMTMKDSVKDGIRELLEVKLMEISVTPFPMNPLAQITAVKDIALDPNPESTPSKEPPTPVDRAASKSAEPALDHSLLASLSNILKGD